MGYVFLKWKEIDVVSEHWRFLLSTAVVLTFLAPDSWVRFCINFTECRGTFLLKDNTEESMIGLWE